MIVTSSSKELLRQAKEIISDPKNDEKVLKASIVALENYQKSKVNSISLRTEAEQETYTRYIMAFNLFDFEINDFIKGVYLLISSNFLITENILSKLNRKIKVNLSFINNESWYMLLNIFTFYRDEFDIILFSQVVFKIRTTKPPSTSWCIQALFDFCYFNYYQDLAWKNLLSCEIEMDVKYLDKLRIINFAVETVGKSKLGNVVTIGIKLLFNDCMKLVSKQSALSVKMELGMLAVNKLHREVDFMLKNLMTYEENVNIENIFIVDFYNKTEKFGFDVSGAIHYLTHDITERQESLDESCLIPFIKLKTSLLRKSGYTIGRIPFYEWNRYIDQTEKLIYLKRKIRLLKLL